MDGKIDIKDATLWYSPIINGAQGPVNIYYGDSVRVKKLKNLTKNPSKSNLFVEREDETELIKELLDGNNVAVIVNGMGGIGKTESAINPSMQKLLRFIRPILETTMGTPNKPLRITIRDAILTMSPISHIGSKFILNPRSMFIQSFLLSSCFRKSLATDSGVESFVTSKYTLLDKFPVERGPSNLCLKLTDTATLNLPS